MNEWDCNRRYPLQQEKERTDRGQEQKQHRAQESCRRRAGEGGKGEAREVCIRRQMLVLTRAGPAAGRWNPCSPWLMAADLMCGALGEQAPGGLGRGGSRWRRVVVDVGGWSVVGARLGCGCGLPPLPRCREQRGSEAHASRVRPCCSTPFPLSSPAVSGCRSVGHAQGRARRWLAAGQRHTWQRPGNQRQRQAGGCGFRDQLITKRGPRGLDEGLVQVPVPVPVPVPVGEVAEVC